MEVDSKSIAILAFIVLLLLLVVLLIWWVYYPSSYVNPSPVVTANTAQGLAARNNLNDPHNSNSPSRNQDAANWKEWKERFEAEQALKANN